MRLAELTPQPPPAEPAAPSGTPGTVAALVDAHVNVGIQRLLPGDFEHGWPEYEWRRHRAPGSALRSERPEWVGSPPAGRTLALHAERGLGDTLQFARFASVLAREGARVLGQVQDPLLPLLRRCPGFADVVPISSAPPAHDCHASLLSVAYRLRISLRNIPAEVPYLSADPALVAKWSGRLAGLRGIRIGLVWHGNPEHPFNGLRSAPLAAFAPLATIPGVRLASLQQGPGTEQIAACRNAFALTTLGDDFDRSAGAFMDSAAVMQHLDVVISTCTSTAHLAGALGVPVWVALSVAPDWRWMLDRDDSPWCPGARLSRQRRVDDWNDVVGRMAEALAQRLAPAVLS